MAEQLICNQQVDGSTPFTSSNFLQHLYGGFPERPKGADCKSVVTDFGGPNPPSPTQQKGLAIASPFCLVGTRGTNPSNQERSHNNKVPQNKMRSCCGKAHSAVRCGHESISHYSKIKKEDSKNTNFYRLTFPLKNRIMILQYM